MARIVQVGWELGDILQLGATSSPTAVLPTVVSATPAPRSGTYCLKCQAPGASQSGWGSLDKLLVTHASKTELYYAVAIHRSDTEANALPSRAAVATYDTAGNVNTILFCEGDGSVRAYYASAGTTAPNLGTQVTLIGSSATTIPNLTWTLIEVHLVAATGATGTCEVKINGASVIAATSQRTCQLNANFGAFHLGFTRQSSVGGVAGSFLAFDDLRVNDTTGSVNNAWPGDEQIRLVVPNGAGDLTQLSRGGTDSGANWDQVNEVPASSADYVTGATVGLTDLYNVSDIAVTSISAINVIGQVSNSDGASGTMSLPTKSPAGQSDGAAFPLTATWTYQQRLLEADPADAAAWTSAKLTALQIGAKVAS